jgi:hypothetical protein
VLARDTRGRRAASASRVQVAGVTEKGPRRTERTDFGRQPPRPKSVGVAVAVALLLSAAIAFMAADKLSLGDSSPRNSLALLSSVTLACTAVAVWRGSSRAAWLMVVLGVVQVMFIKDLPALVLVATSLVAALQLHARGHTRSAELLRDWSVGWRIVIGAALPERLDLIAIAVWVAIAWLIGLVVAEAGALGAVVLFLYLGLGAAEIALIVYLVVRLVRRVRGKR